MRMVIIIACTVYLFDSQKIAYAYIGPGLGAGTISVIFGFIASIFLALFAIVWYPLKRLFKKNRKKSQSLEEDNKK